MKLEFIELEDIIKNVSIYYAHDKVIGEQKIWEPLRDHTKLCQKYFDRINKAKNIDIKIELFLRKFMAPCSEEAKKLAFQMWCNVVTFHDVGKHNPNFQRELLEREEFQKDIKYQSVGTKHSALSAVIHLDYYFKRIKQFSIEDIKHLCVVILCNAYIISRHHSKLERIDDFMNDFNDREKNCKIIKNIFRVCPDEITKETFNLTENNVRQMIDMAKKERENQSKDITIWIYFYIKLTYSMLVAADYYATSEFDSDVEIQDFGELNDMIGIFQIYQKTDVNQFIRKYEKESYPLKAEDLKKETNINVLRDEIFLDAERQLLKEKEKNIFYLEAPTGSGKSNISMNLSFRLAMSDQQLKKIYYIYPFNTLIEQNQETMQNVFQNHSDVMDKISVVNSITPIKKVKDGRKRDEDNESEKYYVESLLNRQFLNYPIVLTTHVSLFDTIFGETKESAFGFHQLAGSILVLDEIQSYRNSIWGEIINFLSELAEFLHMKIIIMSATLPNLEILKKKSERTCFLIRERKKYFNHPCFQNRVNISKELLEKDIGMDELYEHVKKNCKDNKKILIEFITKANAEELYCRLKNAAEEGEINAKILCMSGDDSILERKRTIDQVKKGGETIVLVATQVVEAGLDIDMDIGYKNISKMDSEEQFLGRINRSCSRSRVGIVYFFEIDKPKIIYKGDLRSEWIYLVKQPNIWELLRQKDFVSYYDLILKDLENNKNRTIDNFFKNEVAKLDFPEICAHMKLIEEQNWNMSVFLGRTILDENENELDGNQIWNEYKELLMDNVMSYAKKKVKLSEIRSKMNYFIYEIKQNSDLVYDGQIGELFYVEDGDKYFENGRLNRKKIQGQLGDFVDFI